MGILHAYYRHRSDGEFSIFGDKILNAGGKGRESSALGYSELASDVFTGVSNHHVL